MFRPAAMALVEIDVRPIRAGRRIKVTDASMRCDGQDVGRATAVFLAESEEPPGRIWRPRHEPWPDPASIGASEAGSPDQAGWRFRIVRGGFGIGKRDPGSGPERPPVSSTTSQYHRSCAQRCPCDIACPLANSSDQSLHYINADYTMLIGRYPVGESGSVSTSRSRSTPMASRSARQRSSTRPDHSPPAAECRWPDPRYRQRSRVPIGSLWRRQSRLRSSVPAPNATGRRLTISPRVCSDSGGSSVERFGSGALVGRRAPVRAVRSPGR